MKLIYRLDDIASANDVTISRHGTDIYSTIMTEPGVLSHLYCRRAALTKFHALVWIIDKFLLAYDGIKAS